MSKLVPVSRREFIKKLKKLGFDGPFSGGKHQYMLKDDIVLRIPNPHKNIISVDLLSRILKQARISRKDWIKIK